MKKLIAITTLTTVLSGCSYFTKMDCQDAWDRIITEQSFLDLIQRNSGDVMAARLACFHDRVKYDNDAQCILSVTEYKGKVFTKPDSTCIAVVDELHTTVDSDYAVVPLIINFEYAFTDLGEGYFQWQGELLDL